MIEQYKRSIFTSCLVCFNETFAPISNDAKQSSPAAVIWHEAVSGRKDEDIASAFYKFLMTQRDAETITIWADNCAAQNKNWTLITLLSNLVNSDNISANTVTIKFFEPGHSFMSADSVHARIEAVLRRKKETIMDFEDLQTAVSESGCKVISLTAQDFFNFASGLSDYNLKKAGADRPYLSGIVHLEFRRGSKQMFYKASHRDSECKSFDFLKKNHDLNTVKARSNPRGVAKKKKEEIIAKLLPLMPPPRRTFWMDLPESAKSKDLLHNQD